MAIFSVLKIMEEQRRNTQKIEGEKQEEDLLPEGSTLPFFLKPCQSLNRIDFFTSVIAIGGWSTLARFVVVKDMVERIRKLIRFQVFVGR